MCLNYLLYIHRERRVLSTEREALYMSTDLGVRKQCGLRWPIWDKEKLQHLGEKWKCLVPLGDKPLNKRPANRIVHQKISYTRPSYKDKACTIVGSCLLPSTNSSYVSLASLSRSMLLKILSTRFSGVSSSIGSLTIDPVIL